jgi:hypothetical protein
MSGGKLSQGDIHHVGFDYRGEVVLPIYECGIDKGYSAHKLKPFLTAESSM